MMNTAVLILWSLSHGTGFLCKAHTQVFEEECVSCFISRLQLMQNVLGY